MMCDKIAPEPGSFVPDARRIADEFAEPRCLCRRCLEAIAAHPEITTAELAQLV